ncbi:uncharacterized protein LOC122919367 [Bufo gargarizans]|uniref:uncharacterized protein LOC122919367 n=1 Tax=Bufo gargarizans TaxID=30331 RepID=UPI001CF3EE35|nr:uncharacterized protein LOC122919367 [Bufo gargarizans]
MIKRKIMSRTQKESNIHKVKIQQTYWAKDTTEEVLTEKGALRTGKVVEEVEYYDTNLYDLAVNESWLSKAGKEWRLIIDKTKATKLEIHSPSKKTLRERQVNATDPKTQTSPNIPKCKQDVHRADRNGNTDPETPRNLTCYELVEEKGIIECLSRILHIDVEFDNVQISNFLDKAGIQKYISVSNVTQETFQLRDIYMVVIKQDGVSSKKSVVISINVEIDNVTQGFQRIEHLANELDLQSQHV